MTTMNPYTLMKLNKIHIDEMLSDARHAGSGSWSPAEEAQHGGTPSKRTRFIAVVVSAVLVAAVCWIFVGNLGLLPAG